MSDSEKLRFVYGIISLVFAFVCFGGALSIIFILLFVYMSESFITPLIILGIILIAISLVLCTVSISYFIATGIFRQKRFNREATK